MALLKQHLPGAIRETIEEADEIMQHRFRLLGYRDLDYGREIDWHLDAVHGKRAPLKPWFKVRFLDFEEVGDHKVTWELSRHQHLVTLAKAWAFIGNQRYAEEVVTQFYSWKSANPYPMGINWGSSLEVAFRSLSWLWVRNLLARWPDRPRSFDDDMLRGLDRNARYIERYLSTYFSPNTHLIGEAVALFFIGTLCPQLSDARRWQRQGLAIVLAEAQRQVRPDGVYFEQSLYYHVYALDFFLYTRALAMVNGISVPESFDAVLERMLEVLRIAFRAGAGHGFGDDDGGRLFNPRRNRLEYMTDPLAVGATLLNSDELRSSATPTEEAVWLFGEEAVAEPHGSTQQSASATAFPDGGLYFMSSPGPSRSQMLVDAGPHGIGHGGHGHSDALSVTVTANGRPWLVDPGSYVYISGGDARNQFRGTAAHNTLRVDGLDQAIPEGPFSWRCLPEVGVEQWATGSGFTLFSGVHTGYTRLPEPVLHRRMIFHVHGEYWVVRDVVEGNGEHQLELFWHFAPDLDVAAAQRSFVASHTEKLALLMADDNWTLEVEQGFVSPAYGEKVAALVGIAKSRVPLPAEQATLLIPLRGAEQPGDFRMIPSAEGTSAAGYIYERDQQSDQIIFGKTGKLWELGSLRSDAALLFLRYEGGEVMSLASFDASFLTIEGNQVFSFASKGEWLQWSLGSGLSPIDSKSLKFLNRDSLTLKSPVR